MKQKVANILQNNKTLSLLGNVASAALAFLSIAILARTLSTNDFGIWNIYILTVTFLELFRAGFIHTTLVRFLSNDNTEKQQETIGSGWIIGITITFLMSLLPYMASLIYPKIMERDGTALFVHYFPLLNLVTMPHYFAAWILQAKNKFGQILFLRFILLGIFAISLVLHFFYRFQLESIVQFHLFSNLIGSIISLLMGWSGIQYLFKSKVKHIWELFHFGKYSMGTLVGSNLLRNSDIYIINFTVNTSAVGIFSIPQRVIEIIEIPLRSFMATVLPEMSKSFHENDMDAVKNSFYRYTGAVTLFLIPVLVFLFVMPELFLLLMGGKQYTEYGYLVRIFTVYCLFLPLDRFIGITLDVINKPHLNFIKVISIIILNVIADYLVLTQSGGNLLYLSISNVLVLFTGILLGYALLNSQISLQFHKIFSSSIDVFKEYAKAIRK
jgi:O-antigen/teichoic acid export membrane protein